MATSTLVQDLSSSSVEVSARRKVETYYVGAAVTAGQWVCFDQTKTGVERARYVKPADAGAAATIQVVGCALTGGAAGERIEVVINGYFEGASTFHSGGAGITVRAGMGLTIGATAGNARRYYTAAADNVTVQQIGYALENAAADKCDVIVTCGSI